MIELVFLTVSTILATYLYSEEMFSVNPEDFQNSCSGELLRIDITNTEDDSEWISLTEI